MSATYLLKMAPWVLAAVSTGLLVTVTHKYETLSDQIAEHRRNDMHLRRGEYFPTFTATAVDGSPQVVGESAHAGDRQVIILLTSTCPYCKRTLPTWKTLAGKLDSVSHPNVRVFALTTDSAQIAVSFAKSHDLGFRLIPFAQPKQARLSHAFTVPQTLVVNHEGLVLYSRIGVIDTQVAMDSVLAAITAPDPPPRRSPTVSVPGANGLGEQSR
jgi:peroxiredoxin